MKYDCNQHRIQALKSQLAQLCAPSYGVTTQPGCSSQLLAVSTGAACKKANTHILTCKPYSAERELYKTDSNVILLTELFRVFDTGSMRFSLAPLKGNCPGMLTWSTYDLTLCLWPTLERLLGPLRPVILQISQQGVEPDPHLQYMAAIAAYNQGMQVWSARERELELCRLQRSWIGTV